MKTVRWSPSETNEIVEAFVARDMFDPQAETVAEQVLAQIRAEGNAAIEKCAALFDGADLRAQDFLVTHAELAEARDQVDDEFKAAAREALRRITAFCNAGLKKNWSIFCPKGGVVGEQFVPYERIGVYVPGGAAPLASTALMTATLAKVAGVPEIVACTPCDENLAVNPFLLYALELAGATEIYRLGGIQAIGLMAYGSETVRKVQKIVGPGGAYVTAAKRRVYGAVALDLVAGPSEIAVLTDDSGDPAYIAADLLSQAEHGTGLEKALFVTTSSRLANEVEAQLDAQLASLSRREAAARVLQNGLLIVIVNNLDEGMDLCNRFAPEHLEIMAPQAMNWLKKVKSAGAVFVGSWTPECTGDFLAGPSHVLPTGGAATLFSGLTVDDFRRRTSYISFTRADLAEALPHIEAFGRVEGLDAHAKSARIRFDLPPGTRNRPG